MLSLFFFFPIVHTTLKLHNIDAAIGFHTSDFFFGIVPKFGIKFAFYLHVFFVLHYFQTFLFIPRSHNGEKKYFFNRNISFLPVCFAWDVRACSSSITGGVRPLLSTAWRAVWCSLPPPRPGTCYCCSGNPVRCWPSSTGSGGCRRVRFDSGRSPP